MTPTQIHYLASFLAGALLAGMSAGLDYWAHNQSLDWKPFAVAVAGGAVLFARDYLRNNANVVLENSQPVQIALRASVPAVMTGPPSDPINTAPHG